MAAFPQFPKPLQAVALCPAAQARLEKLVAGYADGYRLEAYLHALYSLANVIGAPVGLLNYKPGKRPAETLSDLKPREAVEAWLEGGFKLFGYLAETVFTHWGVREPRDVGTLYWRLADAELVKRGEHEKLESYFFELGFRAWIETRFIEELQDERIGP